MDGIDVGYGNIADGNRGHCGDREWSQKFGLNEGKLYGWSPSPALENVSKDGSSNGTDK